MVYRYSAHNLLQAPNTYMYTPFEGGQFLNEYFSSRLEKLTYLDVESKVVPCATVQAAGAIIGDWVLTNTSSSAYRNWAQYCAPSSGIFVNPKQAPEHPLSFHEGMTTRTMLQALVAEQLKGPLTKNGEAIWRKAVHRFEVTKRLYEFYGPDLNNGYGGYADLQPYALLSLSCALHYSQTASLIALSAQLKLNDLLCSLPNIQLGKLPFGALKLLVCSEITFIDELIRRKEIELGS